MMVGAFRVLTYSKRSIVLVDYNDDRKTAGPMTVII